MKYDDIFAHAIEKHDLGNSSKSKQESFLMKHFEMTKKMLNARCGKEVTAAGISEITERLSDNRVGNFIDASIEPIIEYFPLEVAESNEVAVRIFTTTNENGKEISFYSGLKKTLSECNGVYIFYDSRGRAIYAGKAYDQSLWAEMNNA